MENYYHFLLKIHIYYLFILLKFFVRTIQKAKEYDRYITLRYVQAPDT